MIPASPESARAAAGDAIALCRAITANDGLAVGDLLATYQNNEAPEPTYQIAEVLELLVCTAYVSRKVAEMLADYIGPPMTADKIFDCMRDELSRKP